MKILFKSQFIIFCAMLLAAGLAVAMKPTHKAGGPSEKINLEEVIPKKFGDWTLDESMVTVVSPDVQEALDKIYTQTLSRTYVNDKGQRVMLSIAHGGESDDNFSVHFPEGCYQGQGFAVDEKVKGLLKTGLGNIPVAHLTAVKGNRIEPITYWIAVGNHTVYDVWGLKKVKLAYALKGEIPDAILMRVSSVTPNTAQGNRLQEEFSSALLSSIPPAQRMKLVGAYAS